MRHYGPAVKCMKGAYYCGRCEYNVFRVWTVQNCTSLASGDSEVASDGDAV